ncbi:MAG: zinc ribbon domain-containing protein [Pirellula sp.]|nr:zinc ribbon domain-containing protein [Pirellula sp.]
MPIYEYDCKKCKKQVEVFVPRADSKPECPDCGSRDMSKLLSVIGAPVVQGGSKSTSREPENCGRSACASGCMFGN